ncbi:peptide alpha-N-acetyltransferase Nat2 [Aspergillus sclerotialis]|uniref:Peptide alpha-N-acetyltransferase Nat2 n=1 Tax=Aspergillus sclerotialis TaxID=2070753 RepID=A0A3A2ZY94_9EURO|nr:peptide alpha-N-acetyltransferase Nat2 [Aspergillus sclerotialis]
MPIGRKLIARWLPKAQGLFQHPSFLSSSGPRGVIYHHYPNLTGGTPSRTLTTSKRGFPVTRSLWHQGQPPSRVRSKLPNLLRGRAFRRLNSSSTKSGEPASFSQRMRKLSREYGWSALGVYLLLSALDFPFCFAAVRLLGVDRIGHIERVIVDSIKSVLPGTGKPQSDLGGDDEENQSQLAEAEQRNKGEEASLWTQLALAYAIHKSFIFFRVPLTAAVTPKVVKVLRRWGWDIGKRKPKGT